MNINIKRLAAGCLILFLAGICLLTSFLVINFLSRNDLLIAELFEETNGESDFPDIAPANNDPAASPIPVEMGEFTPGDCPFRTNPSRISCGYLGVPEDHHDPSSRTITLAVAIVHNQNSSSDNPPLVYLEGGPGGSGLDGAESLWLDSPLIEDRDVILLDQRGTGYSVPTLNCHEYDDPNYDDVDELDLIEDCRDRLLDEGIDINLYNSRQSAADVQALRLALGYPEIDLLGVSYGTRLALTVIRDYPEGIRSVILDSVYPPHVDALNEEPLITIQALLTLTEGCQADPACRQAYPDLGAVLFELIEDLENTPEEIEFWDDYYEEYYYEDYYGLDLIDTLIDYLYDTQSIPYLPAFIYAMVDYQYEEAFEILDIPAADFEDDYGDVVTGVDVSDSEGMYFSVECHEEVGFNSLREAESLAAGYPEVITEILVYSIEDMFETCAIWGSQIAPLTEVQPVISEIPTLVLNGEYDPVTPPGWAESTASYLPNSQLFIFPGYGHAVIDAGSCPVEIMIEFLADPTAPLSPACFSQVGPPDFVIHP